MQIKQLTIRRSTFYAGDFPLQPPMLSFKELDKVYYLICNLCYRNAATQHRELAWKANVLSFPSLKDLGLPHGTLTWMVGTTIVFILGVLWRLLTK